MATVEEAMDEGWEAPPADNAQARVFPFKDYGRQSQLAVAVMQSEKASIDTIETKYQIAMITGHVGIHETGLRQS